ncbi:MAG: 1-acyl-sn-glycerol-3-phosphate acyltransferase [Anaerolineae bacterium]|nr:1-acyl-sn-glycerol-3-phosphate acyltransferase [Anaerolineae bacterium]
MSERVRYYYRRQAVRHVGRVLQALLTHTTVSGRDNVPANGPYIAVGNHAAAIEVALMVVNLPHVPELVGNGDIPLDPTFKFLARFYYFIPVRRGYVDRQALNTACDILKRGHVLGAFPEGGIWEHNAGSARPGVAWLSQQTGAPILPIGFGGVLSALSKIARLKRPHLTVNFGPLLPPVPKPTSSRARREAIHEASAEIMHRIQALLPPDERPGSDMGTSERYDFRLELVAPDGSPLELPDRLAIPYGEDLAYYFHRHVLLEVIYRNYRRTGARPLSRYTELTDPAQLGAALDVALDFYNNEPVFLGYRLGYARAGRVLDGLHALREAMAWAETQNCQMRIIPERTIIGADDGKITLIEPSVKREY